MPHDAFSERGRALEDAFFAQRDAELLNAFRERMESEALRTALKQIAGIDNDQIAAHLVRLRMSSQTLTAMWLVPLVEVAWADGSIDDEERTLLLKQATDFGLHPGNPAYQFLESWLKHRPLPELFTTWSEYTRELVKQLPADVRESMRSIVQARCKLIGKASGKGVGADGNLSTAEHAVLDQVDRAFQ